MAPDCCLLQLLAGITLQSVSALFSLQLHTIPSLHMFHKQLLCWRPTRLVLSNNTKQPSMHMPDGIELFSHIYIYGVTASGQVALDILTAALTPVCVFCIASLWLLLSLTKNLSASASFSVFSSHVQHTLQYWWHHESGRLTMKAISAKQALMVWPRSLKAEHPRIHLDWHQTTSKQNTTIRPRRARHKSRGSNNMQ